MSTERANSTALRTVTLPGGEEIPVLGVGTWGLAERPGHRQDEIAALQMAADLGMTLIDTAEMYAEARPRSWSPRRSAIGAARSSWSARCCRSMRRDVARFPPARRACAG